jgi:hypothetical protein
MLALFHPFLSPLRDFLVHFKVSCRCGYISPLNTWKCISLTRIQYLHTIVWGGGRGVNFVLSGCINCSCLSMSFDKCMHLYNPKFHPNVERYCHLESHLMPFLVSPYQPYPVLLLWHPLFWFFFHCRLVLPVLLLHVDETNAVCAPFFIFWKTLVP